MIDPKEKELNDRFYALGKRISGFDQIREDLKETKTHFIQCNNEINEKISLLHSKFINLNSYRSDFIDRINMQDALYARLEKKLEELNKSLEKLESSVKLNCENTSNCSENIKELSCANEISFANTLSHHQQISILNLSEKNLSERIKSLEKSILKLNSDINYLDLKCAERDKIVELKAYTAKNFESVISKYDRALLDVQSQAKSYADSKFNSESSAIRLEIQSLKSQIPCISKIVDRESLEKLSSRVDFSAMDAKNALLKSSNNETQNNMNVKKIENLQLQITNLSLSKG